MNETVKKVAEKAVEEVPEPKEHRKWYRVNETVVLDGHIFRIKSVKPTELRLKLIQRAQ